MAVFNLANDSFGTTISCSKPAVDGCEVTNLIHISSNVASRNGFIAESFIKPPVDIVYEFPFTTEVQTITINTKVGSQSSSGFEIFASSGFQNEKAEQYCQNNDRPSIFSPVGRAFSSSKYIFCFRNKQFSCQTGFKNLEPMNSQLLCNNSSNVCECELKNPYLLKNVKLLNIRILCVNSGSACALKSVEVWGQPSTTAPVKLIENLLKVYKKILKPTDYPAVENNVSNGEKNEQTCSKENSSISKKIPLEFLDAITFELLVLPMLLPSGHTVNISTIDKHSQGEAIWGRLPSDPFTAIPFTDQCHPVPNTKLKLRIDEFLLQNPQIQVSARTFGVYSDSPSSNIKCPTNITHINTAIKTQVIKTQELSKRTSENIISDPGEKNMLNPKRPCVSNFMCKNDTEYVINKCKFTRSKCSEKHTCGASTSGKEPTHSTRLSSSLNTALTTTLLSLPSFNKKSSPETQRNDSRYKECIFCDRSINTGMYKLVCDHLICRYCLIKQKKNEICCARDNKISSKSNIIKVFIN